MENLRPEDTISVQEALFAGADFQMLRVVHTLQTTFMEIANTGKVDLGKFYDMQNVMAEVPNFHEKLEKNIRALFEQYPELSAWRMIEEIQKIMIDIDVGGLSERLKNLKVEVSGQN